jgi:hypothetical protein
MKKLKKIVKTWATLSQNQSNPVGGEIIVRGQSLNFPCGLCVRQTDASRRVRRVIGEIVYLGVRAL